MKLEHRAYSWGEGEVVICPPEITEVATRWRAMPPNRPFQAGMAWDRWQFDVRGTPVFDYQMTGVLIGLEGRLYHRWYLTLDGQPPWSTNSPTAALDRLREWANLKTIPRRDHAAYLKRIDNAEKEVAAWDQEAWSHVGPEAFQFWDVTSFRVERSGKRNVLVTLNPHLESGLV